MTNRRADVTDSDPGVNVSDGDFDSHRSMSVPSVDTRQIHG